MICLSYSICETLDPGANTLRSDFNVYVFRSDYHDATNVTQSKYP